jgi:hypothetical protein
MIASVLHSSLVNVYDTNLLIVLVLHNPIPLLFIQTYPLLDPLMQSCLLEEKMKFVISILALLLIQLLCYTFYADIQCPCQQIH